MMAAASVTSNEEETPRSEPKVAATPKTQAKGKQNKTPVPKEVKKAKGTSTKREDDDMKFGTMAGEFKSLGRHNVQKFIDALNNQ